jgi:lipopolysaccharide transport system permease protein
MISNALIIKKIYFPRLVIPVSSVLGAVFDFLVAFILFLVVLIWYKQPVSYHALWFWPGGLLVAFIATMGPGCLLAALNVKYRDFRYVIPFVIQVMLFLTPVIYPVSIVSSPFLKYIVAINPVYAAVELFRYPLIGGWSNYSMLLVSLISGMVMLVVGLIYFRRTENFFADLS